MARYIARQLGMVPADDDSKARVLTGRDLSAMSAAELSEAVQKAEDALVKRVKDYFDIAWGDLRTELTRALGSQDAAQMAKAEQKLVKGVEKKCALLQEFAATFPGSCANAVLGNVSACVTTAARCQACLTINAFDDLNLDCDDLDDQNANDSCP